MLEQTGVPPVHIVLQLPQCPAFERSASQPSSGMLLQSAKPGTHAVLANEHSPPTRHVPDPFTCGRFVQSCPHVPQFLGSVVLKHIEPQSIWSGPHPESPPSIGAASFIICPSVIIDASPASTFTPPSDPVEASSPAPTEKSPSSDVQP
jgi:hypothetical protein